MEFAIGSSTTTFTKISQYTTFFSDVMAAYQSPALMTDDTPSH